ncbi:MAG: protein-L-isoaspartate O-methyltransferase [Lysobacteraceae bacterium]|nr:MAG: protein-L-isoaspartate O-methyltransferase [Xanthomonadaceae bacterium]
MVDFSARVRGSRGIGMTSQRTRDRLIERLRSKGITDDRVLSAMRSLPRHLFVDEALATRAYEDTALPIGRGQTISQPYVVALMTQTLIAEPMPKRVLEIGTGSGYQAAVLGMLVEKVYSIERIRELQRLARRRLLKLGLNNVHLKYVDGHVGWAEQAPFDAIILTAAANAVPDALFEQLADGGRLIAPVGSSMAQQLNIWRREGDQLVCQSIEAVTFVPLLGGTE